MSTITDQLTRLLAEQPLFEPLDEQQLAKLEAVCEINTYPMGTTLFEEGAPGDDAYLVLSGRVRVTRRLEGQGSRTLAVLGRGDLVGERAILAKEPRNATVRTADDSVLARIPGDRFAAFYEENPDLQPYLDALARERSLISFLRANRIGQAIPPRAIQAAVQRLVPVSFAAGEVICRQGEAGESMYIVVSGQVKVVREETADEQAQADETPIGGRGRDESAADASGEGARSEIPAGQTLAVLTEGEYFGERSLLLNEPRAATVYAIHDTQCLSLCKGDLDELMQQAPKLRKELETRIAAYDQGPTARPHAAPTTDAQADRAVQPPPQPVAEAQRDAEDEAARPKPRRGVLGRYPWVRQHDERDCGAACLAMAARYYGKRLAMPRLRDLAGVGASGATLYGVAQAGEAIGFKTRALRMNYDGLRSLEMPAIAHWDGFHYVLVYEVTAKRAVIGDPAAGVLRVPRKEFERRWSGHLLQLSATPELLEQENRRTSALRFAPLLKPYIGLLVEILLAALFVSVLGLATPLFTQAIIDRVVVHEDVRMLNVMAVGMLIVVVFVTLGTVLRQYLLVHVAQKLRLRMSADLFRKLLMLPMSYFAKRTTGDILTRFRDNAEVQQLLTSNSIVTLLSLIMVVVYLAVMFWYSVTLTMVALLFVALAGGLVGVLAPLMKRNNRRVFERTAATQSRLIESVRHMEAIKARSAELPVRWRYENAVVDEANQTFHSATLGMQMTAGTGAIQTIATVSVLWVGAHLVMSGDLSLGQLIAFNVLFGMMLGPVLDLTGMWQKFQDAMLSLERLGDIYDAEPEEKAGLLRMPRVRGRIELENLWFRYTPDSEYVLRNVSLTIEPGETVALIGRSGSGKTTLISLLQRLYAPTDGRILIDGIDVSSVSSASLRPQIGVVLQEPGIFTGTIRDNIAFGLPEATTEQVVEAARLAQAHDFIASFPLGYETKIGEVGVRLSGGQRQRLAIARALMADPRILIFDEATSALDTESERAIQRNMDAILHNRTALVIAHRLSTIQHADRIVVLDEGMIAEQGTHDQLIEQRGLYFYLRNQQMGG